MMRKFLLGMLVFLVQVSVFGKTGEEVVVERDTIGWGKLLEAIVHVESRGNPRAVGGNSVGILQITPIAVKDVNQYLKMLGSKKRYTLNDRYDPRKSYEMFILIQRRYNPERNQEKAIRLWNGGCNYSVRATNGYYNRVMSYYNRN